MINFAEIASVYNEINNHMYLYIAQFYFDVKQIAKVS